MKTVAKVGSLLRLNLTLWYLDLCTGFVEAIWKTLNIGAGEALGSFEKSLTGDLREFRKPKCLRQVSNKSRTQRSIEGNKETVEDWIRAYFY